MKRSTWNFVLIGATFVAAAMVFAGCQALDAHAIALGVADAIRPALAQMTGLSDAEREAIISAVSKGIEGKIAAGSFDWGPVISGVLAGVGGIFGGAPFAAAMAAGKVNQQRDAARVARGEPTGVPAIKAGV